MSEEKALEALTASLDYPMLIVTVAADDKRAGCLVGFSTQCSIEPTRFVVCLSKRNHTHAVATDAHLVGVHFLAKTDVGLAKLFGTETGDDIDKFERCRWAPGPGGTPLLDDCPSRSVGTILDRFDCGDHTALLLELADVQSAPQFEPLMFQNIRHLEPGHRA